MIGLDSNVLVRYLTLDDPTQSERAIRLIERELSEGEPGFISILVLMETIWVLPRLYKVTAIEVLQTVTALIGTPHLRIEGRDTVLRAVKLAESSD
jgi:predicted nucleic-acid-binding protein